VAVPAVFVSSVQRGLEQERVVVRDTLRALQMHPLMAETTSASPSSPQRALLDQVALGDYFLLLLGPRYGDVGTTGTSPTEDEFNEAKRLGKPTIVLVQAGDLESAQLTFLDRVRSGGWEGGVLYATFHDAQSIGPAVAGAFAKLSDPRQQRPAPHRRPRYRHRPFAVSGAVATVVGFWRASRSFRRCTRHCWTHLPLRTQPCPTRSPHSYVSAGWRPSRSD
jgi:hypothetical protein